MPPKYNVHINNLSDKDDGDKDQNQSTGKTVVNQVVSQYGENCYNFSEPVSGFHIGDIITDNNNDDSYWD